MNDFESGDDEFAADEPAADETVVSDAGAETDSELDELEAAFATVDQALKALDADDLDGAEALAASLGDTGDVSPDELPSSTEG